MRIETTYVSREKLFDIGQRARWDEKEMGNGETKTRRNHELGGADHAHEVSRPKKAERYNKDM
jgi:hypothetical protein